MMRTIAAIVLFLPLLTGCDLLAELDDDNTPVCVPATTKDCYCNTGGPGKQVCDDDGIDFSVCTCVSDGGVGTDASVGIDASVSIDAAADIDASAVLDASPDIDAAVDIDAAP